MLNALGWLLLLHGCYPCCWAGPSWHPVPSSGWNWCRTRQPTRVAHPVFLFVSLLPLPFIPACSPSYLTAVSVSPACPGRWYIREGWLLVVPSKGEELKRRMFFLFSDILIAAKPCHPLHLLNANKLSCQAVYPLHQCSVDKVFGHTWSQGGLLSVSLPTCARQKCQWNQTWKQVSSCLSSTRTKVMTVVTKRNEQVWVRITLPFLSDAGTFAFMAWSLLHILVLQAAGYFT